MVKEKIRHSPVIHIVLALLLLLFFSVFDLTPKIRFYTLVVMESVFSIIILVKLFAYFDIREIVKQFSIRVAVFVFLLVVLITAELYASKEVYIVGIIIVLDVLTNEFFLAKDEGT